MVARDRRASYFRLVTHRPEKEEDDNKKRRKKKKKAAVLKVNRKRGQKKGKEKGAAPAVVASVGLRPVNSIPLGKRGKKRRILASNGMEIRMCKRSGGGFTSDLKGPHSPSLEGGERIAASPDHDFACRGERLFSPGQPGQCESA